MPVEQLVLPGDGAPKLMSSSTLAMASEDRAQQAEQACGACKKNKRRCDKALPECSLCQRAGRACIYPEAAELMPTAAMFAALRTRLQELEQRVGMPAEMHEGRISSPSVSHSSRLDGEVASHNSKLGSSSMLSGEQEPEFPVSLFLDIDSFTWMGLKLPDPSVAIPVEVLALLTRGNIIVEISNEYFSTIHLWMPIVSKKRMDLGISVRNGGPDIAMLFLAMKLITAQADEVIDGKLYSLAKSFLATLEGSGFISLLCLQSMVLVALYEFGHSIYPAAWMAVGACSRYAEMLRLSCGEMVVSTMRHMTTWTEVEEGRRVWWAIFILDRLISTGSRRGCSIGELPFDGILPVDDEAWEAGDVARACGLPVNADYQVQQSPYARLCQAAVYLGRAQAHTRGAYPMRNSHISDTISLAEELYSFGAVLERTPGLSRTDNFIRIIGPRSLVYSALFVAFDAFTCPERSVGTNFLVAPGAKSREEAEMQTHSIQAVRRVAEQARDLAIQLSARIELDESMRWHMGKISPLVLDQMYASLATTYWILGETGDEALQSSLKDLKLCMETLGRRWKLGQRYVAMAAIYG